VGPDFFSFQSQIDNDLVGFQLGCRNEICLTKKLRAFGRVGAGIFNNRVTSQQNFFDQDGVGAVFNEQQNAGQPFGFNDRQDDLAILGELEAGVTAQISQRARLRFGYRALGVAGVALAGDQIPVDFRRAQQRGVNTNGSLLLGGGFVGIEFCH